MKKMSIKMLGNIRSRVMIMGYHQAVMMIMAIVLLATAVICPVSSLASMMIIDKAAFGNAKEGGYAMAAYDAEHGVITFSPSENGGTIVSAHYSMMDVMDNLQDKYSKIFAESLEAGNIVNIQWYCCDELNTNVRQIVFESGISYIQDIKTIFGGMIDYTYLENIIMDDSVIRIEQDAFNDLPSLKSAYISENVSMLPDFSGCTFLQDLVYNPKPGAEPTATMGAVSTLEPEPTPSSVVPEATVSVIPPIPVATTNTPEITREPKPTSDIVPSMSPEPTAAENMPRITREPESTPNHVSSTPPTPIATVNNTPYVSPKPEPTPSIMPSRYPEPLLAAEHTPNPSSAPMVGHNPLLDREEQDIDRGITIKGLIYYITGDGYAAVAGVVNQKARSIVVPGSVKIDGNMLKVRFIKDYAFSDMKKLQTVVIGKNLAKMGKGVFLWDSKLEKITVKSKILKSVGKNTLKGTNKKCRIYVPKGRVKAYKRMFAGKVLETK